MPWSATSSASTSLARTSSKGGNRFVDPQPLGLQRLNDLFGVQRILLTPDSGSWILTGKLKRVIPLK
jgi:hypothetical protein